LFILFIYLFIYLFESDRMSMQWEL